MASQVDVDIHAEALKGQLKIRLTYLKSVYLFQM